MTTTVQVDLWKGCDNRYGFTIRRKRRWDIGPCYTQEFYKLLVKAVTDSRRKPNEPHSRS